jgi:predicted dehydrogenase
MKFLIVGYGSIGRRHFRNLLNLGERDIVFYRTERSTLPDQEIAGYPVETDLDSALDHDPDAVIIANPTAYHLKAAIPAAEKGCHILLEKPISHNREGMDEFIDCVRKNNVQVLIGYQFRFHPNLRTIKDLLEQDYIGKLLSFRSHWGEYLPDWHPWEDYRQSYSARKDLGGGVVLTLSHNFDYLTWLFGQGKVNYSVLRNSFELDIDSEDIAEIGLEFPEDLIGSLHLNYIQIPPKHTLEIIGSKGSIFWDYYQNSVVVQRLTEAGQIEKKDFDCSEDFDRNDLFVEEMKHFLDLVEGKAEPICSLGDGVAALDLALDALQQAKNKSVNLAG